MYGYPGALVRLVPELRELSLEGEPRATCNQCVLTPEHSGADPSRPWAFRADLKCCTYHPNLANFLVGRALARGGPGAARVEARLRLPDGRTPLRLEAPEAYEKRYMDRTRHRFGSDEALRCPYWVGGEESCGVWLDRNHVCRTWFCKHEGGKAGRDHWQTVKKSLHRAEYALALFCVHQGSPPGDDAPPEEWAAWYVWCARRVHEITDDELKLLRPDVVKQVRAAVESVPEEPGPLPEILEPSVGDFRELDDVVRFMGYSGYDGVEGPRTTFIFLSLLDGEIPWREALAISNQVGEEPLTVDLIEELYRIGALRVPGGEPLEPVDDHPGWFRRKDGELVLVVET